MNLNAVTQVKDAAARDSNHFSETINVFPLAVSVVKCPPSVALQPKPSQSAVATAAATASQFDGRYSQYLNWTVCTPMLHAMTQMNATVARDVNHINEAMNYLSHTQAVSQNSTNHALRATTTRTHHSIMRNTWAERTR